MIHKIWLSLFGIGLLYSFFAGTTAQVNEALMTGAAAAIDLVIFLAGVLVFWTGLLQVANKAKLLTLLEKALRPLIRLLYPKLGADHPALKYLTTNMVSNMFGLGSAATPAGLKAMKELQESNPDPSRPSFEMYTLLVVNTAGFTLIPTTLIGMRTKFGAANPTDVLLPIIFASALSMIAGLLIHHIYSRLKKVPSSGKKVKS
jgi:spore maturation protein A